MRFLRGWQVFGTKVEKMLAVVNKNYENCILLRIMLKLLDFIIPERYRLYQVKYVEPYIEKYLRIVSFFAHLASVFMIVAAVLSFGFHLNESQLGHVYVLYFWVWIVFLVDRLGHLLLIRTRYSKASFSFVGWCINCLLVLTLVPVITHTMNIPTDGFLLSILANDTFHILVLFIVSSMDLSDLVVRMLGKKTNPSFVMASSFFVIIVLGSVLLLMPRCLQEGVHLTWIDSLFISTSAVCVTGLSPIDIATTFSPMGQIFILVLIQIGGLGVMTITSFFALFFMGNTSLYNQMVVRDMVSSDSLTSLLSTLLNILGFTVVIELMGAGFIFCSIHHTLGMPLADEVFFSIFHSVSAFCNAGFSTLEGGFGATAMIRTHNDLFIILSFIIMLGSMGYPILVNFKVIIYKRLQLLWRMLHGKHYVSFKIPHLFDLNTKIVLASTALLIVAGTVLIAVFEWNNSFADLSVTQKFTQSFFNAVSPRTAGFESIDLNVMHIQTIIIYVILMWIGGSSQSTAGGIKVNTFAVAMLNLRAIIHGSSKVEYGGREIPVDSIRRANATVFVSLVILAMAVFVMTMIEPHLSLTETVFECVSALGTVGSSLGATASLHTAGKILIILLMFTGRVGVITFLQSMLSQQKFTKYSLPQENIIIS